MKKLTCVERRGIPGHTSSKIRKPYSPAEMLEMFGPYLCKNVLDGLSPREIKLIETAESLSEAIEELDGWHEQFKQNFGAQFVEMRNLLRELWGAAKSAAAGGEEFPCHCESRRVLAGRVEQALSRRHEMEDETC